SRDRSRAEAEAVAAYRELKERVAQVDRLNRELEERVTERTASLERSNRDLQQFAFVAGHDLQEPLRMVVSFVGLLKKSLESKLDVETERYMAFAAEGAKRMQALILDLLAFSRAGSESPVKTLVKLGDVIGQARYSLLQSIRETDAKITVGPMPEVEVDA